MSTKQELRILINEAFDLICIKKAEINKQLRRLSKIQRLDRLEMYRRNERIVTMLMVDLNKLNSARMRLVRRLDDIERGIEN